VESNSNYTGTVSEADGDIRKILLQEKENLLSMFLANASSAELSAQFKRIDELNNRLGSG